MRHLAMLLFLAVGSALVGVRASEATDRQHEQQFKVEAEELRRSADVQCQECYFVSMLGLTFPLPNRYAAQLSPLEHDCVTFISPRWTLQRPPKAEDSRALRLTSGMIKYCTVAALKSELSQMKSLPDKEIMHSGLSIKIWNTGEASSSRVTVYASDGLHAVWISDPNPYLWEAMLEAATLVTASQPMPKA